ncbi:MAG: hypothetical protein KatS3mg014_0702 [Actinomycetota bacterium]|nr:MAG: hypothetical protein KatS3mg014_0702 [Actinomycetota bacterium]
MVNLVRWAMRSVLAAVVGAALVGAAPAAAQASTWCRSTTVASWTYGSCYGTLGTTTYRLHTIGDSV